jgi:hypothetical protein
MPNDGMTTCLFHGESEKIHHRLVTVSDSKMVVS